MPGRSASRPAPSPCYTSVYSLHREGAHPSEHLTATVAAQEGKEGASVGAAAKGIGDIEVAEKGGDEGGTDGGKGDQAGEGDQAHRALTQERMVIRWHQRFAHMSFGSIARLIGLGVEGLRHLNKSAALRLVDREDRCDACAISNLKEASFKSSTSRADDIGDLAHCDLSGPYTGNNEYTHCLSTLDDHSRKGWTFPIADKSSTTVTKVLTSGFNEYHRRFYHDEASTTCICGNAFIRLHSIHCEAFAYSSRTR
ncbi:hypothetical protein A4X03_0g6275 [Tilletia caries]|uniref:GAG-pre-integrase domain-containing protein n=1 Tax=Tilletia caries TaxID=13290 RepID=A0A8T8T270_9BASI|nr:hypothetical protein A4X03_0g6275 [Tilletia caries]